MQIDRGSYPQARTPWDDSAWRTAALGWLDLQLARLGFAETGARRVRVRPWSVIIRVEAAALKGQPVWFKAASPGSSFEPVLSEALARWVPGQVLTPYAVDADRGWSLLPDGGPMLRTQVVAVEQWEQVLRQYAELQRRLVSRADELLSLGVPDARVTVLPRLFDTAVAENRTLDSGSRRRLEGFRPRLVEWCEELGAIGVPDSLDHADLHDGQILIAGADRYTFFDWGDANVGHPFCTLLVTLTRAAEQHGPAVVPRLEDAYLEAWSAHLLDRTALRRAAELARRLSQLTRAGSWARLFPGSAHLGDPERAAALLRLLD
ncbi:phosphotransferase [Kribbella hippodromi]|uniref:Phosphotransferase n=1 Tax=Kribbella hippodromi TaxID=434347 RepID=A0ABN2EDR9_9ACTN